MKKENFRKFIRSFYITFVILLCVVLGFYAICKAYENMRLISFGEYRSAIEIKDGNFKFFDYSFDFTSVLDD